MSDSVWSAVSVAAPGHEARASVTPTDAGYAWRCDCGAVGFGLPSDFEAIRGSVSHVAAVPTDEDTP